MECPKCQHENPPQSKFCFECGAGLELTCPKCRISLPTGVKFCNSCGHDLSQSATPSETPSSEPSAPTGERRQATVLFSDLSGYTAMNEKLDPEEVEGIMSRIKVEAVKIVEGHGGIVSQFVGDEVLALFGIPTAHEDDPRRAVSAALELHELARSMSPEVEEKIGRPLRMHTGINGGLIVTSLKDVRDGTVGVTGDTVNTGARLKALAEDDQILVSPDTQRRIAPFFQTEALPPQEIKGKAAPVTPYRVTGETSVETRFEASEQRGFTAFTGREGELVVLHSCLEKAMGGQGRFVTVSGEAGLGKSRLLYEFRRSIDRKKVTVLEGRCQSYGQVTPYLPFLDALRRGLRLDETESPEALREKAVVNVREISPKLKKYLPHYLHLLSIPLENNPLPEGLTGEALRRELEEALAAIFIENSHHKPMVALFEDWHWADEASDSALKRLAPLVAGHPLLMVVLHRPEYKADFDGTAHHEAISLLPLAGKNTAAIARSVFGAETLPKGLARMLHERTGGNPYFTEELSHALAEEGMVRVEAGKAVVTRTLERLTVPDTVEAVIRSRVDRLAEPSQEALRLASVIGREFARRLLEAVAEGRLDFGGVLEGLASQELIRQVRLLPEAAYMFKHALMQGVVYETLLLQQRKILHGIVGRAIEALYPERLEEHYEALAHHYAHSDETEKAIEYVEKAGDKAANYFSLVEARKHYREAIRLLDAMEIPPERMTIRIDLSLKWVAVSFYVSSEEHVGVLETSLHYAEELGDESRLAKVTYWIGRLHFILGNQARSLPMFERCIAMAEALQDEELLALSYNIIGRTCMLTAEYSKSLAYLEQGIPLMERLGNLEEVAYSTTYLGSVYGYTGNFEKGLLLVEQALEMAGRIKNPTRQAHSQFMLGSLNALRGNWAASLVQYSESIAMAIGIGDTIMAGYGTAYKGQATFWAGDREEGIRMMHEGVDMLEASGSYMAMIFIYGGLAESYAQEGALDEAVSFANKALELKRFGAGFGEPIPHRALAIASAQGRPPDWNLAEERLNESIRLCRESGERPNLAIGYFRHAELLHGKGEPEQARAQLDQASALFREMEMTWWLKQAEELGKALDVG